MEQKLKVEILSNTEGLEAVIAAAGKLCYSPVGVKDILNTISNEEIEKFVGMLASMKHESPLEHVVFNFAVEGISRACSHQIVRHRIASYSQQSQRYVPLAAFGYIIPPAIKNNRAANYAFKQHMDECQRAYDRIKTYLLDDYMEVWSKENPVYTPKEYDKAYSKYEKIAIEDARYVLPNSCETKMVFSMNVRTLYNFLEHRCCDRAQWEIRELADAMLVELRRVAPILFKNIGPRCVTGSCPEGRMSCGKQLEMKDKYK